MFVRCTPLRASQGGVKIAQGGAKKNARAKLAQGGAKVVNGGPGGTDKHSSIDIILL